MHCQTGKTLYGWIVERRMAQAHQLLLLSGKSVQEMAEAVGCHNTSHFIQSFRRYSRMTLQARRRACQKLS